jgi:hypothetical protein
VMLHQAGDVLIVLNDEYSALHNAYSSRTTVVNRPKTPRLMPHCL